MDNVKPEKKTPMVFYGEYLLRHWIRLILNGNIQLPEYQRKFVWRESDAFDLLNSICNHQFVPPITIGAYQKEGKVINYIIDGQQRLTSILLAYIGIFPKNIKIDSRKTKNQENIEIQTESDEEYQKWTFKELTKLGNTKEAILQAISGGDEKLRYIRLRDNFPVMDDDFLGKRYVGFSYIVYHNENISEENNFFSTLFRNINIHGKPLHPVESRRALYFLDQDLETWFEPEFCKGILYTASERSGRYYFDFTRALALLSQFVKCGEDIEEVAKGYLNKIELYYECYIRSVCNRNQSGDFQYLPKIYDSEGRQGVISKLVDNYNKLKLPKEFQSIIDLDLYVFGLMYFTIFKESELKNIDEPDKLKNKINGWIEKLKREPGYGKSSGRITRVRQRIILSIELYRTVFVDKK